MLKKKNKEGSKSWRIVVRNLPFNITKEEIEKFFLKFGEIKEINLPKCKDKRFPNSTAGFCFIQFAKKKSAEFVLNKISSLSLKDRKLFAAFALDKDTFLTKKLSNGNETQLMQDKIKKILTDVKNPEKKFLKKKIKSQELDNSAVDTDEIFETENVKEECKEDESSDSDFNDEELNLNKLEDENLFSQKIEKKIKFEKKEKDNAISEGRVVFLRNVDFQATNELIKNAASEFGTVSLAILCHYPGTDQPCGTAFVHFTEKSSADNFLNQLTKIEGFFINGRQVYGHRAVFRENAIEFTKKKNKEPKDNRNLHLLRVSLIREGTSQAQGISNQDIDLRRRLMELARNKLKNLTMFVSPNRLAVHNIPFSLNEEELKKIFFKEAKNQEAKIIECRIMKEKVGVNNKGHAILGRSKGFGFVAFSNHTDALNCLKNVNNNPKIFTNERRPIVEFSIENLSALKSKEIRNQKIINNFKNLKKNVVSLNDPAALVETKKSLMKGGQKWMPKRLGKKIRHRDLKKSNKKTTRFSKKTKSLAKKK